MYICYIDESGHCGKKLNIHQPVEVLCGVLTDVTKLFKTQRELDFIIRFLRKRDIPLSELKASDAYRGRRHWSNVSYTTRDRIFAMVLEWAEQRSCKFIVSPIDSAKFFHRKQNNCHLSQLIGYPYEVGSLNIILAIQRLHKSKKKNKGKTLVIFDEQHGHDKNLTELLSQDLTFTDGYTSYKPKPRAKNQEPRLSQIIDIPHFSKSHLSVLIQIADWAAFIVSTYLNLAVYGHKEKYPGELEKFRGWYSRIGNSLVNHTSIDPPTKDGLSTYLRELRPDGWEARRWSV